MALKTKVKAGNITNLSDARYCAGMGVDWLSFPAAVVNPVTFKEITDWVTGPQFVLEVSETTSLDAIGEYPVRIVEISVSQLSLISQLGSHMWMVKLPLSKWDTYKSILKEYKNKISYLVIDLDVPNNQVLTDIASHLKILANQTERYEIVELLSLPIEGISVTGEHELKPGLKDFERLASVLEELEVLDS